MHPQIEDFFAIFEGFRESYGTYTLTGETRSGGKILGNAASVKGKVTRDLWNAHLEGKQSLGIIPINEESNARFAAIDIDVYPLDLHALVTKINEANLPLTVCRTKSGGAHLYLFLTEVMPVVKMHAKLKEMAAFLGYGLADIYPRQTKILISRGDVGNWINMPYFGGDTTNRYALSNKGERLTTYQFVEYVNEIKVSPTDLIRLKLTIADKLPGGPPCLNHLANQGFPPGSRNNGLLNLAVYAKKCYGESWAQRVEWYNHTYMQPHLATKEVLDIIRSVQKKDYNYTCKSQPIEPFCNAAICRTCEHGIGGAELGMPKIGSLAKLATMPPIWFLDVETEQGAARVELTTEELQSPRLYQAKCMTYLNVMPICQKQEHWQTVVCNLLKEVNIIDVPKEATPNGQLMEHLESFCTSKVTARVAEEILLGKPWINNDQIHFRLNDFLKYLERVKFKMLELNRIQLVLQAIEGYGKKFHNLRGKGANCIVIPVSTFTKQTEPFDVQPQPTEPI